jgi:hypothetical protein
LSTSFSPWTSIQKFPCARLRTNLGDTVTCETEPYCLSKKSPSLEGIPQCEQCTGERPPTPMWEQGSSWSSHTSRVPCSLTYLSLIPISSLWLKTLLLAS